MADMQRTVHISPKVHKINLIDWKVLSCPCQELKPVLSLLDGASGSELACAVSLGRPPRNLNDTPKFMAHNKSPGVLVPVYMLAPRTLGAVFAHVFPWWEKVQHLLLCQHESGHRPQSNSESLLAQY